MTFRQVRQKLKADGWYLVHQTSSHEQYQHPEKSGRVTVAGKDSRDVPVGTQHAILKQAGLNNAMVEHLVIYEQANDGGWGAYVPDLPGLGVVADTREQAHQLIVDGISLHIAGLLEDGLPIPPPASFADVVEVAA